MAPYNYIRNDAWMLRRQRNALNDFLSLCFASFLDEAAGGAGFDLIWTARRAEKSFAGLADRDSLLLLPRTLS